MDEQKETNERLDRLEQQVSQILRLVEQLVQMVADNNRAMADLRSEVAANSQGLANLRSEVADLRSEVADLRAEVAGVEQRLTARLDAMEEHQKQDRALWQAESRHFAQAIGVLQRDVTVLKER